MIINFKKLLVGCVLSGISFNFSSQTVEEMKSEFDFLDAEGLERLDTEDEEEGEGGLPDQDGDGPDGGRDLPGQHGQALCSPLSVELP